MHFIRTLRALWLKKRIDSLLRCLLILRDHVSLCLTGVIPVSTYANAAITPAVFHHGDFKEGGISFLSKHCLNYTFIDTAENRTLN